MTIEDAARLAADRDLAEGSDGWDCTRFEIYVRAFHQGAHWQQQQHEEEARQLDDAMRRYLESPSPRGTLRDVCAVCHHTIAEHSGLDGDNDACTVCACPRMVRLVVTHDHE